MSEPDRTDLLLELRAVLDLSNHARPQPPAEVWEETLQEVRKLMREAGRPCVLGTRCHCRPDLPTFHLSPTDGLNSNPGGAGSRR